MANKKVLLIGIDAFIIDFSSPEFAAFPGLTSEKVEAGMKMTMLKLSELGFDSDLCWTDFGKTAIELLTKYLTENRYDYILIGAGIRMPPNNFMLFENMVNTIHELAKDSKICFNTIPTDTVEAILRIDSFNSVAKAL